MSTYGNIKARVSDEMKRGELSVSSTAVSRAVIDAIKFYEKRRFWFNVGTDNLTTSASVATLASIPAAILQIDSVKAQIGNRDYPLSPMSYAEMERIDSGQWSGYPEYYAFYNNQIRLYPIPNGTYTVKVSYLKRLTDVSLSATANASNEWTDDCESMIRKRAKGELFENELRNRKEAEEMYASANREYMELKRTTDGRQAGVIRPTKF